MLRLKGKPSTAGFTFNPQLYLSHCAELIAGMTSPLQEGQLMNKASVDYFWFVLKTELRDTHRERETGSALAAGYNVISGPGQEMGSNHFLWTIGALRHCFGSDRLFSHLKEIVTRVLNLKRLLFDYQCWFQTLFFIKFIFYDHII